MWKVLSSRRDRSKWNIARPSCEEARHHPCSKGSLLLPRPVLVSEISLWYSLISEPMAHVTFFTIQPPTPPNFCHPSGCMANWHQRQYRDGFEQSVFYRNQLFVLLLYAQQSAMHDILVNDILYTRFPAHPINVSACFHGEEDSCS